ncbi:MAG TPA: hypothetical protein PLN21_06890, partial [Gemmatales bacterium]|nr:hypothetical protein [Gemmatales bacterium]
PVVPPARMPAARVTGKPTGALGETPAPRPPNIPTPRRASTPNMGVPLPTRSMSAPLVAPRSPSPAAPGLPRGGSAAGLAEPATDPYDAITNNLPASRGERPSWVTLLMVSIAAFCIGMLILAYLTRK